MRQLPKYLFLRAYTLEQALHQTIIPSIVALTTFCVMEPRLLKITKNIKEHHIHTKADLAAD